MLQIVFQYSTWWLLPALIGSLGASLFLYFYRGRFSRPRAILLASLRFAVLFILSAFLLQPLLRSVIDRDEKPILLWLEDRSTSMIAHDDSTQVRQFLGGGKKELWEQWEDKFQIEEYHFGGSLMPPGDTFAERQTNLDAALQNIQGRYYRQNVGAVVLASDGIYNRGSDPRYRSQSFSYPMYTLAFGDTTRPRDLFIDQLIHNEVSYVGSRFPLEINIGAYLLEGESYRLEVENSAGETVYQSKGRVEEREYFTKERLYIEPDTAGLQRYTVILEPLVEEQNRVNNKREFTIDVLDRRLDIAMIASGVHPDMGAIRNALVSEDRYEVSVSLESEITAWPDADIYILHQPGSDILQKAADSDKPLVILTGLNADFQSIQQLLGLEFSARSGSEEVFSRLNMNFTLFDLTEEQQEFFNNVPPVQSPYGKWPSSTELTPVLYQKVGQVETRQPLLAFKTRDKRRMAFFMGEGLWRWRLYNFRDSRNHRAFDQLWTQMVKYLTTNTDRRRFVVEAKPRYQSDEKVRITARLYNPALELTNTPEVSFHMRGESGEVYDYSFSRSDAIYELEMGRLEEGVYQWEAATELADERFDRKGSFVVEKQDLERVDLVARHRELKNMAEATGGALVPFAESAKLGPALLQNTEAQTMRYREELTRSLMDERWLFFLLLLLISTEWALRKYWGNY